MSESLTIVLTGSQASKLEKLLDDRGFTPRSVPYALFSYSGQDVVVTVYRKNTKLLVQGRGIKDFVEFVLEPEILGESMFGSKDSPTAATGEFTPHFGIDESGKGDYFGPLVIAGVYADATIASALLKLGVCDSKLVSSAARISKLAAEIKKIPNIAYEVVRIGPERYNEMYAGFGNLNRLLAWGHVRVIEVLMGKVPTCREALSDQFAHESVLKRALASRSLDIRLVQKTKAESDLAVAAASILARERFVNWMDESSEKSGLTLPLGASKRVVKAARQVVDKYGEEMLGKVVKLHFKTTQEVLSPPR